LALGLLNQPRRNSANYEPQRRGFEPIGVTT
jgi:hypothetical protein